MSDISEDTTQEKMNRSASLDETNTPNGKDIGPQRPPLQHRSSLPTNLSSPLTSPRSGAVKAHSLKQQKMDMTLENSEEDPDQAYVDNGEIPEPERQAQIIAELDAECTCTYAMARTWYKKWEEYVGISKSSTPPSHPGPIEMDVHNDNHNDYVNEEVWKHLVRWYGISTTHQLDRKHMYFKDEKIFDICILSPYSGIVEHAVKKFNRFEEIGYIECQLRRIFHIDEYKATRLWISEKAQVPRFRQLLLRFRMLNDCIHRDKMYILALEESLGGDSWPSGEPGDPKGELSKWNEIISGPKADDYWTKEINASLNSLTMCVTESIIQTAERFLQNGKTLLKDRETTLERIRKAYENKLEAITGKEELLDEKTVEVGQYEEKIKKERENQENERQEFQEKVNKFEAELKQMEDMHKIQDTRIKLDIGGQVFTTSIHTLKRDPDSMLAAMFSGRHELKKEADGSYFIDRDGTYFRYILNFLRDDVIDPGTLPADTIMVKELLREAKYYQLRRLVEYLEEWLQINGK